MKEKVRMIVLRAPLMGEDIYRLKSGDQVMVEGTFSSNMAEHKTLVSPVCIRTEPSGFLRKPGIITTGRISLLERSALLVILHSYL
jgi:hypothetical protein